MRTLLLVVLLAAACGGAQKPAAPTVPPTPEAVIIQAQGVIEQWRQGYEVRSVDALAPLYARTADVEAVHQGRRLRGWPLLRDQLTSFFTAYAVVKVLVADLHVVAIGSDGALVAANVTRRFGDGTTTVEEVGSMFWLLRRVGESWQIVGEAWSYAPAQ